MKQTITILIILTALMSLTAPTASTCPPACDYSIQCTPVDCAAYPGKCVEVRPDTPECEVTLHLPSDAIKTVYVQWPGTVGACDTYTRDGDYECVTVQGVGTDTVYLRSRCICMCRATALISPTPAPPFVDPPPFTGIGECDPLTGWCEWYWDAPWDEQPIHLGPPVLPAP